MYNIIYVLYVLQIALLEVNTLGFWDSDYDVRFSYREGGLLLGKTRESIITVKASSEYDAERSAKKVLSGQYKDFKVLSVKKSRK